MVAACLLAPALGYVAAPAAADQVNDRRIAFNDQRAELVQIEVRRPIGTEETGIYRSDEEPLSGITEHEGQAALRLGDGSDPIAFVSTEGDDPAGDVYVGLVVDEGEGRVPRIVERTPVTCDNDATEVHPQFDEYGERVVYASNLVDADNPEGDFELYLATRDTPAGVGAAAGGGCPGWDVVQLTDNDADDLWPSWMPQGDWLEDDVIVYSSTRDDPLGDIWAMWIDGEGNAREVRQSDNGEREYGVAETQPVGVQLAGPWILFTSTQVRRDGSLVSVPLRNDEESPIPAPESLWLSWESPQSSQAAVSPYQVGEGLPATDLAFTTTQDDPRGDVWLSSLWWDGENDQFLRAGVGQPTARTSLEFPPPAGGSAESHPAWRQGFAWTGDEDGEERATLVVTRRGEESDIADAFAVDGSDRRLLVDRDADDTGPAYSPDGGRMAFSSDAPGNGARELVVAGADGSDARSLRDLTGWRPGDVDLGPVFSPDGSKIAFTRYRWPQIRGAPALIDDRDPPRVWVVENVDDPERARAYPLTQQDPESSWFFSDTDPTWSQDGRLVVVSRTLRGEGGPLGPRLTVLPVASPDEDGSGEYAELAVVEECSAETCTSYAIGSSPAWSPDESRIVFENDGALWQVDVGSVGEPTDEQWANHLWPVLSGGAITGFRPSTVPWDVFNPGLEPTPSRARISAAYDPAWSPDGSEIAFAGQPAGQPDMLGIWAIKPDGTGLRRVADDLGPEGEPAWRPESGADLEVDVAVAGSPADPDEPLTITFTVANLSTADATGVELTTAFTKGAALSVADPPAGCAADGSGCTVPRLAGGDTLSYVVTVIHDRGANGKATGEVTSANLDPVPGNNRFVAPYLVTGTPPGADLAVRIELGDEPGDQPAIGYVGGTLPATVTVTNTGPQPAEAVLLRMRYPRLVEHTPEAPLPCSPVEGNEAAAVAPPPEDADGAGRELVDPPQPDLPEITTAADGRCDLGRLGPGQSQVLEVDLPLLADGEAVLRARAATETPESNPANDRVEAPFEVLAPTIRLLPAVARPGMVVLAYGEDMPPGTEVALAWDRGITVDNRAHTVAEDGTLRASLLVVRRDRLGPRTLVATSLTDSFSPLEGDLLVALRLMTGPGLFGRG